MIHKKLFSVHPFVFILVLNILEGIFVVCCILCRSIFYFNVLLIRMLTRLSHMFSRLLVLGHICLRNLFSFLIQYNMV